MGIEKNTSIRPSRSERPGMPRMLATLMVDPSYWVYRLVAAVIEGVTRGIIRGFRGRKRRKTPSEAPPPSEQADTPPDP